MLHNRHLQTRLLDTDREILATKGCALGRLGVLLLLLWSLVVDRLLTVVNRDPYHVQGYAHNIVQEIS